MILDKRIGMVLKLEDSVLSVAYDLGIDKVERERERDKDWKLLNI